MAYDEDNDSSTFADFINDVVDRGDRYTMNLYYGTLGEPSYAMYETYISSMNLVYGFAPPIAKKRYAFQPNDGYLDYGARYGVMSYTEEEQWSDLYSKFLDSDTRMIILNYKLGTKIVKITIYQIVENYYLMKEFYPVINLAYLDWSPNPEERFELLGDDPI